MQHFLSLMIPTTVPLGRGTSTSGEQAVPRSWFPEALPTPPPPQALVALATLTHNSSCAYGITHICALLYSLFSLFPHTLIKSILSYESNFRSPNPIYFK